MMINAFVPADVSYATRLTPASVNVVSERVFTSTRSRDEEVALKGKTMTDIVAEYGRGDMDKGMALFNMGKTTGDLQQGSDGLWYTRSAMKKARVSATDDNIMRGQRDMNETTGADIMKAIDGTDWSVWAVTDMEHAPQLAQGEGARRSVRASSVKSGRSQATTKTTLSETAKTHLQGAYDKTLAEIRRARRAGRMLRQVQSVLCILIVCTGKGWVPPSALVSGR